MTSHSMQLECITSGIVLYNLGYNTDVYHLIYYVIPQKIMQHSRNFVKFWARSTWKSLHCINIL